MDWAGRRGDLNRWPTGRQVRRAIWPCDFYSNVVWSIDEACILGLADYGYRAAVRLPQ
jgi:hypothetical protein